MNMTEALCSLVETVMAGFWIGLGGVCMVCGLRAFLSGFGTIWRIMTH